MNKTELIAAVAESAGKNKAEVKEILDALTAQIVKTVKEGDEVALLGFGTSNPPSVKPVPAAIRRQAPRFIFPLAFNRSLLQGNSSRTL